RPPQSRSLARIPPAHPASTGLTLTVTIGDRQPAGLREPYPAVVTRIRSASPRSARYRHLVGTFLYGDANVPSSAAAVRRRQQVSGAVCPEFAEWRCLPGVDGADCRPTDVSEHHAADVPDLRLLGDGERCRMAAGSVSEPNRTGPARRVGE